MQFYSVFLILCYLLWSFGMGHTKNVKKQQNKLLCSSGLVSKIVHFSQRSLLKESNMGSKEYSTACLCIIRNDQLLQNNQFMEASDVLYNGTREGTDNWTKMQGKQSKLVLQKDDTAHVNLKKGEVTHKCSYPTILLAFKVPLLFFPATDRLT